MRTAGAGVGGLATDGNHLGLRAQARADHNDARRSDVPGRVHGSVQLHIDIVDLGWTVATSHRSCADPELRETLNHTVRNMQRIAGLPVDPIPCPLPADLHILQPAYGRAFVKRAGSEHYGPNEFCVISQSHPPIVQSVQGEGLIVTNRYKVAKSSVGGGIEHCDIAHNRGIRIYVERAVCAAHHVRVKSQVLELNAAVVIGVAIPDLHAIFVEKVAIDGSARPAD